MTPTQYHLKEMIDRVCTPHVGDRIRLGIILRGARAVGEYEWAVKCAMEARARWLVWITHNQSNWMRKISKRPQRNRRRVSDGKTIKWVVDLSCMTTRQQYVECK